MWPERAELPEPAESEPMTQTPREKARERQAAGNRIRGAVAGRQHAVDDLERGQTPMGADKAEKLLDIGKSK